MTVQIDEQIACADRELKMRQRVYPRWVAGGKMTQAKADAETRAMAAILETLRAVQAKERLI